MAFMSSRAASPVMQVIRSDADASNILQATPPTTTSAPAKFVPDTVRAVPPPPGPCTGSIEVMAGVGWAPVAGNWPTELSATMSCRPVRRDVPPPGYMQ